MASPTPLEAPARVATDRLAEIEQKIVERIREFEVTALLELLASIGHGPDDIAFRAYRVSGPQPTLLHEIEFPPRRPGTASARVLITVNLGLLSCRSPLPSYFQRLLGDIETSDPVLELIDVLDRSLLHTRLTWDHRERALAMWDMTRRNFLRIFGLDSPLGLDWLFRRVFPELGVEVSVLGPLEAIDPHAPGAIVIGQPGLVAELGTRRGLLLPQVAPEWGWTVDQFLRQTCVKAGLPADAWQHGGRISRFEAEVFGD